MEQWLDTWVPLVPDSEVHWHTQASDVASISVGYVAVALTCSWAMRQTKIVYKLNAVKIIYNILMSIFSLWMFLGCYRTLVRNWKPYGYDLKLLLCDDEQVLRPGFGFWFYWFYMSKYIEFVDTAFIILAGKSDPSVAWYLQVYHHATTASVAWVAWFYPAPSFWVGAITNTFVHVIMYAYYAVALVYPGVRKFGHLVTYIQLTQFYFCCFLCILAAYTIYGQGCKAAPITLPWLSLIYTSYLLFFLAYNRERSARPKEPKAKKQ